MSPSRDFPAPNRASMTAPPLRWVSELGSPTPAVPATRYHRRWLGKRMFACVTGGKANRPPPEMVTAWTVGFWPTVAGLSRQRRRAPTNENRAARPKFFWHGGIRDSLAANMPKSGDCRRRFMVVSPFLGVVQRVLTGADATIVAINPWKGVRRCATRRFGGAPPRS
jgi:hypothetical protein